MIRTLIVGSGAREHALAWKLAQSPDVEVLYVAPGNPGTAEIAANVPLAATDVEGIVRFAREDEIDLVVVGPEAPLAIGLADRLRARGIGVVGPNAAAARIESSKAFAKDLMQKVGVPTAAYRLFEDAAAALTYIETASYPLVVKADGLASGKGVTVCGNVEEARSAIGAIMLDRIFGAAGDCLVIEEALSGPEVSLLAFVDGERIVPLPLAQDHKRLCDGDAGPNTGGMGAYAPVPFIDSEKRDRLMETVMAPVVEALADMGTPYRGFLFAGLMLTADGPRVLEFNCRLGDPEAQVILPLLDDDLLLWLCDIARGRMEGRISVREGSAAGVVLAAPGYPEKPRTGTVIEGLDELPSGVLAFHAGTALDRLGRVITAGGRVMTVVGMGGDVEEALHRSYTAPVSFEGMQRRSDIGRQALAPLTPGIPLTPGPSPTRGEGSQAVAIGNSAPPTISPLSPCGRGAGGEGDSRDAPQKGKLAVFASGNGSNLQSLIDACEAGRLSADISLVVSHNEGAFALDRARAVGIPGFVVPIENRRDPAARRRHEEELLTLLAGFDLDVIVLAGWMLVLSADFLDRVGCPIVNLHPSLLPLDPANGNDPLFTSLRIPVMRGARTVRDALAQRLPYTGVTVHYVVPEVDAGPVILREVVSIVPWDDEESLYARIKSVEHRLLPRAIQTLLNSSHIGGDNARNGNQTRHSGSVPAL